MKYNVSVGSHPAQVTINLDGKGGFTGVISNTQYGDGQITNGTVTGNSYQGDAVLGGHDLDFRATVSGQAITGHVELKNWPHLGSDITGTQAA